MAYDHIPQQPLHTSASMGFLVHVHCADCTFCGLVWRRALQIIVGTRVSNKRKSDE
jgi:hypothetical protein